MDGLNELNIFGVEIDCLTAKAAMQMVMEFFATESVNTLELVTMDMLIQGQDNDVWKEHLGSFDLVLPGDCEILKALKITDRSIIRETENKVFLKLLLRYLQKIEKKVFLVSQTEETQQELEHILMEYNSGITITGTGIIPEDGSRDELVINDINGVESDCVISVLPSPQQEDFIVRNQALLNTKLWIGCGNFLDGLYGRSSGGGRILRFLTRKLFHYRVEKHKKNELE